MTALQAEPPVPTQCPLDATIVTLKRGDMLPDALLEDRLPRHQLEAESVLDHGEASADEASDAGETTTDIIAAICWHVRAS